MCAVSPQQKRPIFVHKLQNIFLVCLAKRVKKVLIRIDLT